MSAAAACLVLRLAGPLQSWGARSEFNRRDTQAEPTKSGVLGLLAAAKGRRRHESIEDLLGLTLGVRTDQPGSLLRDYHTVSDYRGIPLPSAGVTGQGRQKPTSPAKYTGVTQRYYLQDAVFVVAVQGPSSLLEDLATAVRSPAFPLALGRRSCPPTQPVLLVPAAPEPTTGASAADGPSLWQGGTTGVLSRVPWQASTHHQHHVEKRTPRPRKILLPVTVDDPDGSDLRKDLPLSFDPLLRAYTTRRVTATWIELPPWDVPGDEPDAPDDHDYFALLGG